MKTSDLKSFEHNTDKKLNISDVMKSLSVEEQEMIEKGKKHWNLDILNERRGGYVNSETIKELIDTVIVNTWTQAKVFYGNSRDVNKCNECGKELEKGTVFCSVDCRQHYYR